MAKDLSDWLSAYGVSHQNKTNKTIHWVCVPVITWTVIALLWEVSVQGVPFANMGVLFILGALAFYARLSIPLMLGMAVFASASIGLIVLHEAIIAMPLWQTALSLFVVAWVGQFIGHKIEGAKPSFFEDLQFLLIGPVWLLSFLYTRYRISY